MALRIRREQMTAFTKARFQVLVGETAEKIARLGNPHFQNMSDEERRMFVERAISKAREYGIVREIDVRSFIEFSVLNVWSAGNEKWSPQARAIVDKVSLSGKQKANRLSNLLVFSGR